MHCLIFFKNVFSLPLTMKFFRQPYLKCDLKQQSVILHTAIFYYIPTFQRWDFLLLRFTLQWLTLPSVSNPSPAHLSIDLARRCLTSTINKVIQCPLIFVLPFLSSRNPPEIFHNFSLIITLKMLILDVP